MKLAYTIVQTDRFGGRHEVPVYVRRPHRIRTA